MFELTDPSGLTAGHIEVTLRWKFPYTAPSGSVTAAERTKVVPEKKLLEDEDEAKDAFHRFTPQSSKVGT